MFFQKEGNEVRARFKKERTYDAVSNFQVEPRTISTLFSPFSLSKMDKSDLNLDLNEKVKEKRMLGSMRIKSVENSAKQLTSLILVD